MNELEAIEEVEIRHQKCEQTTREQLQAMAKLVAEALEAQKKAHDTKPLKDVAAKLKKMKVVKKITQATIEYHSAIKKAEKVLDQKYTLDVNEAARHERLDPILLKKVILNHLYREGLFDVADTLAEEAGLPEDAAQEAKKTFSEMHRHLELICKGELGEPLAWAQNHRASLCSSGTPSALEFKLQRLLFLQTLEQHGVTEALQYAQVHLQQFQGEFMPQIKQLMGRLLYSHRALDETPYGHLHQAALLEDVATDFTKATCRILGQASTSELLTVAAAGSLALPQLCKLAKVTKGGMQGTDFRSLGGEDQMPIEIELSPEFYFHSIFACPVSKEQCLRDNPPKMLPCGHVLGSNTIDNLAGLRASTFKCPYCPEETSKEMCRTLTFPDIS